MGAYTKLFFKFSIVLVCLVSCRSYYDEPLIRRANPYHMVKDSFYFRRDTLNHHHVILPNELIQSIDTIIEKYPLKPNYYWVLSAEKDGRKKVRVSFTNIYCEKQWLWLDADDLDYKASIVRDKVIFIRDEDNLFPIDTKKPYLKLKNPQKMEEFYKRTATTWFFIKDEEEVRFEKKR